MLYPDSNNNDYYGSNGSNSGTTDRVSREDGLFGLFPQRNWAILLFFVVCSYIRNRYLQPLLVLFVFTLCNFKKEECVF